MFFARGPVLWIRLSFFFLFYFLPTTLVFPQATMDPPHDPQGCLSCHDMSAYDQPNLIPGGDETVYTNICLACHNGVIALNADTHSSANSSTTYGTWSVGCSVCHNQHIQPFPFGGFVRKTIDLSDITVTPPKIAKNGYKSVVFTGPATYADGDSNYNGICEICHTETKFHRNTSDEDHTHYAGQDCIPCHSHSNGFAHGGGGVGCDTCHGHEDGYAGSPAGTYFGSTQSHSTHTETDDDLIGPRPILVCADCHDINDYPYFNSGSDGNGDGKFNLSETDVCNTCHSPGGPYDGLNNAVVGAKTNWRNGVYTTDGTALTAGKERWCVTCHDSGPSTINGRVAPDIAGNNSTWGYYIAGHGIAGQECGNCHGLDLTHNFDGLRTYRSASNNYNPAFRLKDVGGQPAMGIPSASTGCSYNSSDFNLCYSCHSEESLLSDTKAIGAFNCGNNPYKNAAAITTGFRNDRVEGYNWGAEDIPANIHWDHLADTETFFAPHWFSDGTGAKVRTSCPTCHNVHGGNMGDGTPTPKMTKSEYQINYGSDELDGDGNFDDDYGQVGPGNTWNQCSAACHNFTTGMKYYRQDLKPQLVSISVADNNSADPAPADGGYTNSQSVTITIASSGEPATEMEFAENPGFTANSTGWISFAASYTYSMSAAEGSKSIYGRLRNGNGNSATKFDTVILDTTDPVVSTSALTSPNGAETLIQDTVHNITWTTGDITDDTSLKSAPVSFAYSTDSGGTYPNTIVTGEANDGSYSWTVAPVESSGVRIKLLATDRAGNQGSDASDADLAIQPAGAAGLGSITVTDNNSLDPAAAEAGYTNSTSVDIAFTVSNHPTEMICAQDVGFSVNIQPDNAGDGWGPYTSSFTYPISGVDGSYTIYCKVRNILGESGSRNSTIILDTIDPSIQTSTLTAPNGNADPLLAEYWPINSSQTVTWTNGDITDSNIKANPISLSYSTNSGASYSSSIITDEANDGSYTWAALPANVRFTARVQLTATDKAGNQSTDASDNDFKVSPPYKFIITDPGDTDTLGTLRYALNNMEDSAIVWFRITTTANQVAEINVASDLPDIINSGVTFDGDSQEKLVGNSNPNGPEVRIKGPGSGSVADAFVFNGDTGWIENLQVGGFRYGAYTTAADFVVLGCQFGFGSDSSGYSTDASLRNAQGIALAGPSTYAYIGSGGANRNYIACSTGTGLWDGGTDNYIDSNIFGILPDNATECANTSYNINLAGSSTSTVVRNTMCGSGYGIYIQNTSGLRARTNLIGVQYNGSGWVDCTDSSYAIYIDTSSGNTDNVIGGPNVATADNNLRDSNVIDPGANIFGGIRIRGTSSIGISTKIYGNFFGTNPEEDETFPGVYAIYMNESSSGPAYIGGYDAGEAGNVIANMSTGGIYVDSGATPTDNIGINRNSFYNNGTSAALSDDAIFIGSGENNNITRPVIDSAVTTQVNISGVANGDIVEVYISDYDGAGTEYGEGRIFAGSATASGATVVVPVSGVISGNWVTATRTSVSGANRRSSAFSSNVLVP